MTTLQTRFDKQLTKIDSLLKDSQKQKNSALWLFENDLRTPFFMLEGLARIYSKIDGSKIFNKLKQRFKTLEDILGQIDYYTQAEKTFAKNKKITAEINNYFTTNKQNALIKLGEILKLDNWYNGERIAKIKNKLSKLNTEAAEDETAALSNFYTNAINKIHAFVALTTFKFNNVEDDVHELRRKLRWLSIYAQALQGGVKLVIHTKNNNVLKHYLTPEIKNSPYNVLPKSNPKNTALQLDKNIFYALSWLINQLGNIKDIGLNITILKEAIQASKQEINEAEALELTYKILGPKQIKMEVLLQNVSIITAKFFKEGYLQNLLVEHNDAVK